MASFSKTQRSKLAGVSLSTSSPNPTNGTAPTSYTLAPVGGITGLPFLSFSYDSDDNATLNKFGYAPLFSIANPYMRVATLTEPDDDPKLRKDVIKFYYHKLKHEYFNSDLKSILKFIIVEDSKARLVKSIEEFNSNKGDDNIDIKVRYILDNIFGKYELEGLIATIVARSDEITWYKLQTKYKSTIRANVAKKIIKSIRKRLSFNIQFDNK